MSEQDPGELTRVQLTGQLHLWQRTRGHRTATDDILCAWAGAAARPGARRVLDLGCGHGGVTLMLAGVLPEAEIHALEIQEVSYGLAVRNVAENGLHARVRIHHGDLRDSNHLDLGGGFDLVTGTPPFMPPGTGTMPRDPQRAAARFELHGGIEDYCVAAARHVAPGGLVSLVMDGARPKRYERAFRAAGLPCTRRIPIRPRDGAAPVYEIFQGGPGGADGPAQRDELSIRLPSGAWTDAFRAVRAALDLPGPTGCSP